MFKTQFDVASPNVKKYGKRKLAAYSTPTGKSETVPDMTLSVAQIIQRQTNGLANINGLQPVFNGDRDLPDIKHLDYAEVYELRQQANRRVTELQSQLQEEDAQRQKDKAAKEQKLIQEHINNQAKKLAEEMRQQKS